MGRWSGGSKYVLTVPNLAAAKGGTTTGCFALLDYEAEGLGKPLLVVVTGLSKPVRTLLARSSYAHIRELGDEYRARNPRSIA
jgi:hypothetical protein